MGQKLRYGMVGGGPGSLVGDGHRRALRIDNQAELVAGVFSTSLEKSKETAEQLGVDINRVYQNYQEMAEKESQREDKIDFVVIVTPNYSHFEICKAFLEKGFHISCDKPLTTTLEEALELDRLAKEKNVRFLVTYTYSGYATVQQARKMIDDGLIGKIRFVQGEYAQGWLADENIEGNKQAAWRTDPSKSGKTNALGDIGTHIENVVYRMTGLEVVEVLARMEKKVEGRKLDDNSSVFVNFKNGATGNYWCSQIARGHDNGLVVRVYGEKGSIIWKNEENEKLFFTLDDQYWRELHRGHNCFDKEVATLQRLASGHAEGWLEAMANLYKRFMEAIVATKKGEFNADLLKYPTLIDGIRGIAFVEACIESNEHNNTWVKLK